MSVYSEVQEQQLATAVQPLADAALRAAMRARERRVRALAARYPTWAELRDHLLDHHGCDPLVGLDPVAMADPFVKRARADRLHQHYHRHTRDHLL